jgi:uncharacterized protein YecT (DUF1311 family)
MSLRRQLLARLNSQYRQRLAVLDSYRDAACRFETAQVSGGSIFPTIWAQCLTGKTETASRSCKN